MKQINADKKKKEKKKRTRLTNGVLALRTAYLDKYKNQMNKLHIAHIHAIVFKKMVKYKTKRMSSLL